MFSVNEQILVLETISKEIRNLKKLEIKNEILRKGNERKIKRLEEIRHKIAYSKANDEDQLMSLEY